MIKYILTDLDGVIRIWNNERLEQLESEHKIETSKLLSICFQKELLDKVVTGKITDEEWRTRVWHKYSKIHNHIDIEPIFDSWNNSEFLIDHQVMELYKKYFPQSQIVLVTNGTSKLKQDLQDAAIFDSFDIIFNSSEMGVQKPETAFYQKVATDLGCRNDEMIYIDDTTSHCQSGRDFGIESHQYADNEGLESFLKEILK